MESETNSFKSDPVDIKAWSLESQISRIYLGCPPSTQNQHFQWYTYWWLIFWGGFFKLGDRCSALSPSTFCGVNLQCNTGLAEVLLFQLFSESFSILKKKEKNVKMGSKKYVSVLNPLSGPWISLTIVTSPALSWGQGETCCSLAFKTTKWDEGEMQWKCALCVC